MRIYRLMAIIFKQSFIYLRDLVQSKKLAGNGLCGVSEQLVTYRHLLTCRCCCLNALDLRSDACLHTPSAHVQPRKRHFHSEFSRVQAQEFIIAKILVGMWRVKFVQTDRETGLCLFMGIYVHWTRARHRRPPDLVRVIYWFLLNFGG